MDKTDLRRLEKDDKTTDDTYSEMIKSLEIEPSSVNAYFDKRKSKNNQISSIYSQYNKESYNEKQYQKQLEHLTYKHMNKSFHDKVEEVKQRQITKEIANKISGNIWFSFHTKNF